MEDKRLEAFGRLLEIMDELRVKCPWDREQTMDSLRNCTIEETYELVDAITERDYDGVKGELGDLLLHIVFYSKIADEEGHFDIEDVIDFLCNKLVYRHPHVFADVEANDSKQVKYNWEQLKLKEKKKKGGILGGVPVSLPAMVKAFRIGQKAASAGFDWQKKENVWSKVREEACEVEAEIASRDHDKLQGEFGDLLFALVNAARLYGVDPELALECSNKKFIRRFNHIEAEAAKLNKRPDELTLEQMEEWWTQAKAEE